MYVLYKKISLSVQKYSERQWKIRYCAITNQKMPELKILISIKVDFRKRNSTRDKEEHYIEIKCSFTKNSQKSQKCIHLHNRVSRHMKQKPIELKRNRQTHNYG